MNIIEAMSDEQLFARWFRGESWAAWRAFLAGLFGLPMTDAELGGYRKYTNRETAPTEPAREAWVVAGRRAGKSVISALIAVYLAAFRSYEGVPKPGERATVMLIAADRRQARVVLGYIRGFFREIPMLAKLVEREIREGIDLVNGITIEVHTSSFRSVRGYTLAGAVLDEVSFWRSEESANPDIEVATALRPGLVTISGALLLGISSPYARRGLLWRAYRDHFGKDGDPVLVWNAPSLAMNPTIPSHIVENAYEDDPAVALAEWGAQFRTDVESFVSREAVEACVVEGRHELPPVLGVTYSAFVDPSGGSADSMTLAIAHREEDRVILDAIRERRPPFSPESVVEEFAETLHSYRVTSVTGDRYAGEWPREQFRKRRVVYVPAEKPKSDLYQALLPAINGGRVELLDHKRLMAQLCTLERRTSRGGRDSIDHAPKAHDDVANAVAGVVSQLVRGAVFSWGRIYSHPDAEPESTWVDADDYLNNLPRGLSQ